MLFSQLLKGITVDMGVLCGPGERVPTDITKVGQFGVPSLGFTAELLAVIATTLGDSWPLLATRNRGANLVLTPVLQPVRCSLAECQDPQGKVLRFPLHRNHHYHINNHPKHLAYIYLMA